MASGRHLLARLDAALTQSRNDFRTLDIEVQSTNAALARNHRRQVAAYQTLARQRLVDIERDTLIDNADHADREAARLLDLRTNEMQALEQRISENAETLEALRQRELEQIAALESAEQALEARLSDVDNQLAASESHQALVAKAEKSLETVTHATEKLHDAQAQREQKRVPYDNDPLFSYLWESNYGTSDYRAGLLTRFMDGLIAKHIRFESARRNFHTLNEIPRQLAKHVERLEGTAAADAQRVVDAEIKADRDAGADKLEADVEARQTELSGTEGEIETAQTDYGELLKMRQAFADGRDPDFRAALKLLTDQMRADPIPELSRAAALTPTPEDDSVVTTLAELRDEHDQLAEYIEGHRELHSKRADRMNGLIHLRRKFRERGFHNANSVIDDRGAIETLLAEFMRGLVSRDRLWRRITKAQRFQRSRISSSRPGRIGGTRMPRMPRSVRTPRSVGRSGGFGGGGFRTKGGF
ncbi:MAG: hypothetical protein AAGL69_15425 [Pseudomonadota bacterium]